MQDVAEAEVASIGKPQGPVPLISHLRRLLIPRACLEAVEVVLVDQELSCCYWLQTTWLLLPVPVPVCELGIVADGFVHWHVCDPACVVPNL